MSIDNSVLVKLTVFKFYIDKTMGSSVWEYDNVLVIYLNFFFQIYWHLNFSVNVVAPCSMFTY